MSISAQAAGPAAAPEDAPAGTVPDDKTAVALHTAHAVSDMLHHLGHAAGHMQAARDAAGDLRAHHSGHLHRHIQDALDAGHDLTAVIREHYPAEADELEQVRQAVGLAASLTPALKSATVAHLLETVLHEATHGVRHAEQMQQADPDDVWTFNSQHCAKHLAGALEHVRKLKDHFADNYPDVGRWLKEPDEIQVDGGTGDQHARYTKANAGTISGQLA